MQNKLNKIDKLYRDLIKFVEDEEYEYGAMLVRTITEIIVNSYTDYYVPEKKENKESLTIMEQIVVLEKTNKFSKIQINNLHEMRKLGNMGSHQGKEEVITKTHIRGVLSCIEKEIENWKEFNKKGYQAIQEIKLLQTKELFEGEVKKEIKKVKTALIWTIIILIISIYFTANKAMQFLEHELNYDVLENAIYWGCILVVYIFAAYCRNYGKIHKWLYNIFVLYILIPRVYYLCFCNLGRRIDDEMLVCGLMSILIAISYLLLIKFIEPQKGGIVGYR